MWLKIDENFVLYDCYVQFLNCYFSLGHAYTVQRFWDTDTNSGWTDYFIDLMRFHSFFRLSGIFHKGMWLYIFTVAYTEWEICSDSDKTRDQHSVFNLAGFTYSIANRMNAISVSFECIHLSSRSHSTTRCVSVLCSNDLFWVLFFRIMKVGKCFAHRVNSVEFVGSKTGVTHAYRMVTWFLVMHWHTQHNNDEITIMHDLLNWNCVGGENSLSIEWHHSLENVITSQNASFRLPNETNRISI